MLSPISNVRFGSGAAAAAPNDTTTTGILDRPGAFSKPLEGAPAKDEVDINNPGKATKKKQGLNLQVVTLDNGQKVRVTTKEARTMKKVA